MILQYKENKMINYASMNLLKIPASVMAVTVMMFSLSFSGGASATTGTVDGIRTAGEYTGTISGVKSLLWWNGHESIYDKAAGNMNDLYWEINEYDSGTYSLNLFFEVPTYARRMIWAKDCEYKTGETDTDCSDIPVEYLQAYEEGSHHGSVKMDYDTQTGSEYFLLNGINLDKIKWQDQDNTDDNFTWATSREYLIKQGICTKDKCLEFDMTASIELMWLGLNSFEEAHGLLLSISDMELHLSDEARGLPPVSAVSIPAAVWLFGSVIACLTGFSRFKKKAA